MFEQTNENKLEEPKYEMVKQHVMQLLKQDIIRFGEKLPSEHELMSQFNVSRNTIRQAFSELTSLGLIYKEQGKGTYSKFVPKSRNSKKIVAVITTYISDYIFPDIIFGIEEVLSGEGYSMLLSNTNNNKDKETQFLNNIIEHDVAGLIIEPTRSALANINQPIFDELIRKGVKIVFINATYDDVPASSVLLDDERGGFLAAEHLIRLGHTRIAGIFKKDDIQGLKRRKGFVAAMKQYKLPIEINQIVEYETTNEHIHPYILAKTLLSQPDRPTAFVCYNDNVAAIVVQAIRDRGLSIPESVAVVGFDDSKRSIDGSIKLTSVIHPKIEMGRRAASFMIEMLDNQLDDLQFVYRPELIIRESTGVT
ncbi:MAG: GntR family transcriptional regulator [Eubacteriales bacterium]|nr:GntR family transcriptional regulator [Eubacteriales bacterium]